MASILIQHKGEFRMWNTVVDQWETKLMDQFEMYEYLIEVHKHSKEDARNRIYRKGKDYPPAHVKYLKKNWDGEYLKLCEQDRRSKKEHGKLSKKKC